MKIQIMPAAISLAIDEEWIYVKIEIYFSPIETIFLKQIRFWQTAILEDPIWDYTNKKYIERPYQIECSYQDDDDIPF